MLQSPRNRTSEVPLSGTRNRSANRPDETTKPNQATGANQPAAPVTSRTRTNVRRLACRSWPSAEFVRHHRGTTGG
jgi:hypothetical protein